MLLADRFAITVAPASAPYVLDRNRRPEVLADLREQHEGGNVAAKEQQVDADRHTLAEQLHVGDDEVTRGTKLALLVVLAVLGQVALRHDPEQPAAVDHDRAVEQATLDRQRRPDDDHRAHPDALGADPLERVKHRGEQCLLVEEVVDRVGAHPELREDDERRVVVRGTLRERQRALGVERRLGRAAVGHGARDADESVAVQGAKRVHLKFRSCRNATRRSVAVCDGPVGIGDPVAPRADVESRRTARLGERENDVRGGHA